MSAASPVAGPTAPTTGTDALDTVVSAETPEGILIELRPAGLSARAYAFAIDLMIRMVVLSVIAGITEPMQGVGLAVLLIAMFVSEWLYPVLFELSGWAATPGKRVVGLTTVMDNGLPITPAASFTRNLLRVADFLPLAYGFAIVCMLTRRDFKRLGDVAAATLVVYRPRPAPKIGLSDVEPIAPALPLALRDQSALIALAVRAHDVTQERLDELAAIAAPVTGDTGSGPAVTRRVLGVARWLLGWR
ncbi:RDD family protein [Steroidobacter sp.]|uniref:RDD family protein n=1 Tax=Steroidobacter sp. TaxID=1978227 RepID=UPI001A47DADA|nr:RDD family protein [Steroidobacter sp.]MBL8266126.1 RDD family protein [Steroidobacter sp.]